MSWILDNTKELLLLSLVSSDSGIVVISFFFEQLIFLLEILKYMDKITSDTGTFKMRGQMK